MGGCPISCRIFASIPDLPLDASSTPSVVPRRCLWRLSTTTRELPVPRPAALTQHSVCTGVYVLDGALQNQTPGGIPFTQEWGLWHQVTDTYIPSIDGEEQLGTHLFSQSISEYISILISYYTLGAVLETRDTKIKKISRVPALP